MRDGIIWIGRQSGFLESGIEVARIFQTRIYASCHITRSVTSVTGPRFVGVGVDRTEVEMFIRKTVAEMYL
jgi:hypothetical protein